MVKNTITGIYKITNIINNKCYIGSSKNNFYKNNKERCKKIKDKIRRFSNSEIKNIFLLNKSGKTNKEISLLYKVNPSSISRILCGRNYKHLNIKEKDKNYNIKPNKLNNKNVVLEIWNKLKNKENQYNLAKEYKLNQSTISRINTMSRNFSWLKNL